MATGDILTTFGTVITPTWSFGGIINANGRITDLIDNTTIKAPRGWLALRVKTGGSAPNGSQCVRAYLIRNSQAGTNIQGGRYGTAALGVSDATITTEPLNAEVVGTMAVGTGTALTYDELWPVYDPGPKFSFLIWNGMGSTSDVTNGNHLVQWLPNYDQIQ